MNRVITQHPSQGIARISRISHTPGVCLNGSNIKHSDTVQIEISRANEERCLSTERMSETEKILEVELSSHQLGLLITSVGRHEGVPVTIRYTEKDGEIPGPKFNSVVKKFQSDMSNEVIEAKNELQALKSELKSLSESKKYISKEVQEGLMRRVNKVDSLFGGSSSYIQNKFDEHMETVTAELASSFEDYMLRKTGQAGKVRQLIGENETLGLTGDKE